MKLVLNILFTGIALAIASYILPGVGLSSWVAALFAALIFGVVNTLIKPIVIILTLPINLLTLGLFTLIINALMVLLVAAVVPGFEIAGFWNALIFSIIVSVLRMIFNRLDK